jgi:hypothetical protein
LLGASHSSIARAGRGLSCQLPHRTAPIYKRHMPHMPSASQKARLTRDEQAAKDDTTAILFRRLLCQLGRVSTRRKELNVSAVQDITVRLERLFDVVRGELVCPASELALTRQLPPSV